MASRFKIVDEEYIKELKDKSENETRRKVLEERFQKVGEWKKLPSKFRRARERWPRSNTVAVLYCRNLAAWPFPIIDHKLTCSSLYTTIKPLSCSCSSLLESLALQTCHTRWQYVRWGNTATLYSWSLALIGIKFLSRIRTAILWLASLPAEFACSEKFNLESIVTPKSLRVSAVLISTLFMPIPPLAHSEPVVSVRWPMFNVGYFLRFLTCRLDLYHLVPWSALALSLDVTSSWLWSLWYIWWPPANIDMSVDTHRGRSSRSRFLTKERRGRSTPEEPPSWRRHYTSST